MSLLMRMRATLLTLPLALAALLLSGASVAAATPAVMLSCDKNGLPQVTKVNCDPFYIVVSGFSRPVFHQNLFFTDDGLAVGVPLQLGSTTTPGGATIFSVDSCFLTSAVNPLTLIKTIEVRTGAETASATFTLITPPKTSCQGPVPPSMAMTPPQPPTPVPPSSTVTPPPQTVQPVQAPAEPVDAVPAQPVDAVTTQLVDAPSPDPDQPAQLSVRAFRDMAGFMEYDAEGSGFGSVSGFFNALSLILLDADGNVVKTEHPGIGTSGNLSVSLGLSLPAGEYTLAAVATQTNTLLAATSFSVSDEEAADPIKGSSGGEGSGFYIPPQQTCTGAGAGFCPALSAFFGS